MEISTDVRDEGSHLCCCSICGKALQGNSDMPTAWWCNMCHRQYGLTTWATAPDWVKFLLADEQKRRRRFLRDANLASWEAIGELEDADYETEE